MVKTEDVHLRIIPPPPSPPLSTSQPPPAPPLHQASVPATSSSSVFRHYQIATIKRNLNFLQRATQQPPPVPLPTSPPHTPAPPANQSPPARQDCHNVEPAWTTFKNHFQVPYPPPGYGKNAATPAYSCPPPPLGRLDAKPPEQIPLPIRRPSAEHVDSTTSFEFALEAEKMVSELCSSSKDFSEKVATIDTNRFEMCERRRQPEPWSMKPREVRTHDINDCPQTLRITPSSLANVPSKTGIQLPCIYEDDLSLRDFIVKSCIEVGNTLKGHERNAQFSDLVGFCRMVRDSAENPSAHEFHQDEVRSQILTFFRLASSWLSIYPLIERAGLQRDDFRIQMYRYFNDWQIATCRMMELIVKNMPSLKERLETGLNADAVAYGDQVHRRQPYSPMHHDPQNSTDNLKRQRSVPNVTGHHRQWRQRRFSDHHYEENHNWHRTNPQNPRDANNRNKWTVVSPDVYHPKAPHQSPFRKSDNCQDKSENPNRYRSKMHSGEVVLGRSPVFNDDDKTSKWKYHAMYPSAESEHDFAYKMQDDSSQDGTVERNHAVPMSHVEPRCIQKHSDQQPVDLDALFQGYRVANETPTSPSDRPTYKPAHQGQSRYGCKVSPQNRGRRWFNNYNFCPPPWVTNAAYDQDDPHDGVYMKPGSYDVPKREQKPAARQLTAPPPGHPPAPTVITPPALRFKPAQTDEVTWQAALASAETFCKSLRLNENQVIQSDAQQQWMIQKSNSGESNEMVAQSHPEDDIESAAAVADVAANKSSVKKSKSSRSPSMTAEESPPPPPPRSPPYTNPPPSSSPPSQPTSGCGRSLSPSASQKIRRFLETVWAVNEASHMKFSSDQENGVDGQKVLEDTFQRLLDEGWAAGGAAAATAAAAAVSRRQAKQQ